MTLSAGSRQGREQSSKAAVTIRRGDWQVSRSSTYESDVAPDDMLASTDFDSEKDASFDMLQQKFREADTKGTGKLGVSEIRNLLECTESFCYALHVMTTEETMTVIKKYDEDGDNQLDFQEFINFANDKLLLEAHLQTYEAVFK